MSLVGSLEDLGLGDILQIICLSGKSGVLHVRADAGEGRILFDEGRIRIAHLGPVPPTRESLDATDATPGQLDEKLQQQIESTVLEMFCWASGEFSFEVGDVAEHAGDTPCLDPGLNPQFLALEGTRLADERAAGLGPEPVEEKTAPPVAGAAGAEPFGEEPSRPGASESLETSALPGASESLDASALPGASESLDASAVPGVELLESVGALEGDPFDDQDVLDAEPWPDDSETEAPATLLGEAEPSAGLSLDEAEPSAGWLLDDGDAPPPVQADQGDAPPPVQADQGDASPLEQGAQGDASPPRLDDAEAPPPTLDGAEEALARKVGRSLEEAATAQGDAVDPSPSGPAPNLPPLVLIDPDLAVVEWARRSLPEGFPAAHLFQTTDQGVERIRQYLRRAQPPLVVLSASLPADALSGARSLSELLERLQRQAPHMRVLLLEETGRALAEPLERLGAHRGRLSKPTATQLADPRLVEGCDRLGRELRAGLLAACGVTPPSAEGIEIGELRAISMRLRDSASGGEVLPQVMAFATRSFSRVALFMIREEEAQGIAQVGLPLAGGPDDQGIREVALEVSGSGWLRKLVETRAPLRLSLGSAPSGPGDTDLVDRLGSVRPREAWLGPIVSAQQVVAFLYADRLPVDESIGDTAALEVVLHHAGLALDRAALERALDEPGS